MRKFRCVLLPLLCLATPMAMAAPEESRAIVANGEQMSLQTVTTPRATTGQVLIKVYAASVNPVDWKRRATVPGFDVAGVVDSVGPGITAFKVGDAVYGRVNGGYAEYAIGNVGEIALKPKQSTFEQAAGVPIAGVAGYRAVEEGKVASGQRVAIIGAAGGSGSFAVQLAKARGARVVAIGHSTQQSFLRSLGADEFVAYDRDDVAQKVGKVDVALNLVDGQVAAALGYVRSGGHLASIAGDPGGDRCAAARVICVVIAGGNGAISYGAGLEALAKLADEGKYQTQITRRFPLAQAAQAQALVRGSDIMGKVVLLVDAAKAGTR